MKAALVNLSQVARARARRPPHPRELHRARRHPDARHRRRPAGEDAAAVRRARRRRRGARRSTSRPTGRGSSPARRSTSTAATSRPAAGAAPPTAAGSPRASRSRERAREVRRRARRAQPALPSTTRRSRPSELGYESVWLPEHLVFTRAMSRSPHPGEEHPPVPPDTPIYDAFAYLAFLAARTERVRLGTHVFNIGLRHPFTTARGVQTVDLLSGGRFEFGIGASWLEEEWHATRARLRDARPAGRRGDRGVQAALDRGDGHAPRRVLLVRRGGVRAEAGAAAVAADPRRRRVEGRAAPRRASRRRLARHGPHVRVGRGADRRTLRALLARVRPAGAATRLPDRARRPGRRRAPTCAAGRTSA